MGKLIPNAFNLAVVIYVALGSTACSYGMAIVSTPPASTLPLLTTTSRLDLPLDNQVSTLPSNLLLKASQAMPGLPNGLVPLTESTLLVQPSVPLLAPTSPTNTLANGLFNMLP